MTFHSCPMKTTIFKYPRRARGQVCPSRWVSGIAAISALLLATTKLTALPSVTTITGGPTLGNNGYAGYVDGDTAAVAQFNTPIGMALDTSGNFLYVADRNNNAIRELNLSGNVTFTFATYGIDQPVAVSLDHAGNVLVLNHSSGTGGSVQKFDMFGNFLGTVVSGLSTAKGMVLDSLDNIYITVNGNTVLQIQPDGTLNTIATINVANTLLRGITIVTSGFLAVADSGNNGIWLIDPSTGEVSKL